jgi:hypothetical protein
MKYKRKKKKREDEEMKRKEENKQTLERLPSTISNAVNFSIPP